MTSPPAPTNISRRRSDPNDQVNQVAQALAELSPSREVVNPYIDVNYHQVAADAAAAAAMPNPAVVNFEDENGVDDAGALREASRAVEKLEFDQKDLSFFFNQLEIKMGIAGVKQNYTKFQVLSNILPKHIQDQVKSILRKKATDFPNNDGYKILKNKIIQIFGPRPEAAMERALSLTLTSTPSALARELVELLCKHELNCDCCPDIIVALWKRLLPSQVRANIAGMPFTRDNFESIIKKADDVFSSNVTSQISAVSIAAVSSGTTNLDETQPAIPYPDPEVAAIGRGGRGGRGRGFRGRGNRGGGRGSNSNSNSNRSSAPSGGSSSRHKGTKHPDLPNGDVDKFCFMHFRWGRSAHFCQEPGSCPWKNVFTPKNTNQQ